MGSLIAIGFFARTKPILLKNLMATNNTLSQVILIILSPLNKVHLLHISADEIATQKYTNQVGILGLSIY
jgi:hypothetical protein